jgi:integrase
MRKLTATALQALLRKPPQRRVDLMDGGVAGLMLRVGRGGATWSLRVRVVGEGGVTSRGHQKKGNKARVTLGEYPALSIEGARALANTYLDQAKKGVSPAVALEATATAGGLTVEVLAQKFLDEYVRMKELRALLKYEGAIRVHIVPHLGHVLADVLSRDQVRASVKKVMVSMPRGSSSKSRPRGGKEAARSVVAVLRKMINWGIRERLLKRTDNPLTGMEDNLPKKKRKSRVLSLEEARIVWQAAPTLGYPFGPAYQLIMLTGCRPGEWSACLRSYVDLKQKLLVIPADAYKSDHVHVVPLVMQAIEILDDVLSNHRGASGEHILSGTDGKKRLAGWSKVKARMMRAICAVTGEKPLEPWTPHDLRRTVATRLAEQLGVGGEQLIKRVLGHADGSVTAIYNRYGYVKEMRAALEAWAADLKAAPNVTSLYQIDSPLPIAGVEPFAARVASLVRTPLANADILIPARRGAA